MTSFDESYQRLRRRFLERTRQDLEVIRVERDPAKLRPVVHRLSGAAGTFGAPDLSAEAGEVDDVLMEGRLPPADVLDRLIHRIEAVLGSGA